MTPPSTPSDARVPQQATSTSPMSRQPTAHPSRLPPADELSELFFAAAWLCSCAAYLSAAQVWTGPLPSSQDEPITLVAQAADLLELRASLGLEQDATGWS
jgi:hypothetical protein